MTIRVGGVQVAAAFAQERDASYAVRLIGTSVDAPVTYTLRRVLSESGDVQMVVLEATFADPRLSDRIRTSMRGAHGIEVPVEVLSSQGAVVGQAG